MFEKHRYSTLPGIIDLNSKTSGNFECDETGNRSEHRIYRDDSCAWLFSYPTESSTEQGLFQGSGREGRRRTYGGEICDSWMLIQKKPSQSFYEGEGIAYLFMRPVFNGIENLVSEVSYE